MQQQRDIRGDECGRIAFRVRPHVECRFGVGVECCVGCRLVDRSQRCSVLGSGLTWGER
ncbi:MAG: hypothetical protein KTQ12_10660 [Dermatophilaceae bacterium]|nr:hypothetical protein [Dermatophilaceae bacterium]